MKEFKILEFKKKKTSYEQIEYDLAKMSAEGWDVVSMHTDISEDLTGKIIVLLQKER